jgi:hypothetical protein
MRACASARLSGSERVRRVLRRGPLQRAQNGSQRFARARLVERRPVLADVLRRRVPPELLRVLR